MTIRVAHVDVKRMAKAVAPRPAFDLLAEAKVPRHIATAKNMCRVSYYISEMMKYRATPAHQYEVVRIALTVHEGGYQRPARVVLDVIGDPKAYARVKFLLGFDVGHGALKMIYPQRRCASVISEIGQHARLLFHSRTKLQRQASRVRDVYGKTLMGLFDEAG